MRRKIYGRREWGLEPETVDTVARMVVSPPTDAQVLLYDSLIKDIKRGSGLKLNAYSLITRFSLLYIRAAHSKEAALLNWAQNTFDGTEVGTIRFQPWGGVGGTQSPNAYINNNFRPAVNAGFTAWTYRIKAGAYVSQDFNGTIMGARDTRAGGDAHAFWLTHERCWLNVSWGTQTFFFNRPNLLGFYEGARDVYGTNVIAGHYQGALDINAGTAAVRNPVNNLYSLARNDSNGGTTPSGAGTLFNTVGFCYFEFHGSNQINSRGTANAVTKYLQKLGFENLPIVY